MGNQHAAVFLAWISDSVETLLVLVYGTQSLVGSWTFNRVRLKVKTCIRVCETYVIPKREISNVIKHFALEYHGVEIS